MKKFIPIFSILLVCFNLFTVNSYSQVDLSKGLVAWYSMSGNAKSSVGTGMDATVTGATLTTDRYGNANSAYYFDGNSSLVANFNSSGFKGISYSAWIKTNYTAGYEVFIQNSSAFVGYINRFTAGHFMAAFDGGTGNNASTDESSTNVATGEWIFVSASNDGDTTRVYVNGVFENSYAETLSTNNGTLDIGADIGNSTTMFHGTIDEVKVYSRQLSNAEMEALYQEGCPGDITNGLVAWYEMNGNAKSSVGTGMDATVTGATLTTDRFGVQNRAYYFDGNSSLVANFNSTGFKGISYSAWIKTNYTTGYQVFIQNSSAFVGYINRFTAGHFTAAFDGSTGNNSSTDESSTNVASGEWQFVSASNDGYTTRVYVNGEYEHSYAETLATNNGTLDIGADIGNSSTMFHGSIDEVRVYNRMLCDYEMMLLYNSKTNGIDNSKTVNDASFEISPNPSNGIFNIKSRNMSSNTIINIFDVEGKLIKSGSLKNNMESIDMSNQKAGVYIISVRTPEEVLTKRVIIE